jgi:hypothetical protein
MDVSVSRRTRRGRRVCLGTGPRCHRRHTHHDFGGRGQHHDHVVEHHDDQHDEFTSSQSMVTAAQLGGTWHAGCPVDPDQLRLLQMDYWGFDNEPHVGTMVVNASMAASVIQVFSTLYADRFPINEMVPESAYGGNDNAAAAADDTSGFNCRYAVAPGPPQWSMHAYGEAIDVNDVQNPYIEGTTIIPPTGGAYQDRSDVRPGMAVLGGTLVDAFASIGWQWGGRWTGSPDYQHFSSNGQ